MVRENEIRKNEVAVAAGVAEDATLTLSDASRHHGHPG